MLITASVISLFRLLKMSSMIFIYFYDIIFLENKSGGSQFRIMIYSLIQVKSLRQKNTPTVQGCKWDSASQNVLSFVSLLSG